MLAIAILAAGKGSRMKSDKPKVLQQLAGKALIRRVLSSCKGLEADRLFIIVGHKADVLKKELENEKKIEIVVQNPQNGTGHAIQQLLKILKSFKGDLLVLNGDVPLLKEETIRTLIEQHKSTNADVSFLTAKQDDPTGYGRVFSDKYGNVKNIIEEKDCDNVQKKNNLTNAGIYCFNWLKLKEVLPNLSDNNTQREIYLTDAISMLKKSMHLEVKDNFEVFGINDRIHLANCEDIIQERIKKDWLKQGVSLTDFKSCTISEDSILGRDVIIEPQTHLKGKCVIGDGCILGPGSLITDSKIGANTSVILSVVEDSILGEEIKIGPFAHIRPETTIGNKSKIGNFVEIKKSNLSENCKVNHLSYIGDSMLGVNVNIGAGTITANYDGKSKHKTIIGDFSKTGANSVLVAPINIGKNVTVGAGSTLTKAVPDYALAISRNNQKNIEGWVK